MWRTWLKIACLYATVITSTVAITIDKCELIEAFRQEFAPELVDDWVCIARWESHYNTSAIGTLNWDGSKDLGLFQISEKWWCEWGSKGKGCRMDCNDFIDDDISDDIRCVKKIFKEHKRLSGNGLNAWVAWKTKCQGDLSEFLEGCDSDRKAEAQMKPKKKIPSPGIVSKHPNE